MCWLACPNEWDVILQEILPPPPPYTPPPKFIVKGVGEMGEWADLPICLMSCIYTNLNESARGPFPIPFLHA